MFLNVPHSVHDGPLLRLRRSVRESTAIRVAELAFEPRRAGRFRNGVLVIFMILTTIERTSVSQCALNTVSCYTLGFPRSDIGPTIRAWGGGGSRYLLSVAGVAECLEDAQRIEHDFKYVTDGSVSPGKLHICKMARKKRQQAQGAAKPAPVADNSAPKMPLVVMEAPPVVELALSEANSTRPAADADTSSTSNKVAAECAATLRDINRGARQVLASMHYTVHRGRRWRDGQHSHRYARSHRII